MMLSRFTVSRFTVATAIVLFLVHGKSSFAKQDGSTISPVRSEMIQPSRIAHLHAKQKKKRSLGGNPRTRDGVLVFDGATDGNRQVDPQIAVGKKHVLHGTNAGFTVYDKQGNLIDGVSQNGFMGGIDPKMFYCRNRNVFGFDLWVYWDKPKKKPVHISISESGDPTQAWNTYSVFAPEGRDGGAIGFSHDWVGYSFPGGPAQTFVLSMEDCVAGKPTKAFHFPGNLGHPVQSLEKRRGLLFFRIERGDFVIREVSAETGQEPVARVVARKAHGLKHIGFPPQSPQKGTDKKTASGDRNPKAIMLLHECLWFSQTVNIDGRAAIQWHQVKLDGSIVQTGVIADPKRSLIQTTLVVNDRKDVIIGFQETGEDMFISPRVAIHKASDAPGKVSQIISLGEGLAATEGGAWGDYSSAALDGDNGLDLWTAQSIADKSGRGDVVIAKIDPRTLPEAKPSETIEKRQD